MHVCCTQKTSQFIYMAIVKIIEADKVIHVCARVRSKNDLVMIHCITMTADEKSSNRKHGMSHVVQGERTRA